MGKKKSKHVEKNRNSEGSLYRTQTSASSGYSMQGDAGWELQTQPVSTIQPPDGFRDSMTEDGSEVDYLEDEEDQQQLSDVPMCRVRIPRWVFVFTACVSLAVATFDIVTDVLLLEVFINVDSGIITIIMVFVIFISGILFILEFMYFTMQVSYFCCKSKKLKRKDYERYKRRRRKETRSLVFMHEAVTYLLLLAEDLPVAVILFMLTQPDSQLPVACQMYQHILVKDTLIDELALLAGFISAIWKGVQSLRYLCVCQWYGCESDWAKLPCGCARGLRPLLASVMCFCTAFVYFVYAKNFELEDVRPDCVNVTTTTLAANVTYKP